MSIQGETSFGIQQFPGSLPCPGSVVINSFIPMLRKRLTDIYITNWREGMEACSSLSLFRHVKKNL